MHLESSIPLSRIQRLRYLTVAEATWGCVPVDVDWAMNSPLYKAKELKMTVEDPEIFKTFCVVKKD